jgi:hypothetical protein
MDELGSSALPYALEQWHLTWGTRTPGVREYILGVCKI